MIVKDLEQMHSELQDEADGVIKKIIEEYCSPNHDYKSFFTEDQFNFIMAVCRVITEEMIDRYDELPDIQ